MHTLQKKTIREEVVNMSKIKTAFSLIQTPRKMIVPLADKGLMNWIPDKLYLQMIFRAQMDRKLDLKDDVNRRFAQIQIRNLENKSKGDSSLLPIIERLKRMI